jgi:hypothetical protein
LKDKIKKFLKTNKQLITQSLAQLEAANKGIKTLTEETRDIVEQALMSGQAPFAKALQRISKDVDPRKYFGQTDKAKLERVIKDFRERIFDKTQVVYLKYGLWGKEKVQLEEVPVENSQVDADLNPFARSTQTPAQEPVPQPAQEEGSDGIELTPVRPKEETCKETTQNFLSGKNKTLVVQLDETEKQELRQLLRDKNFDETEIDSCLNTEQNRAVSQQNNYVGDFPRFPEAPVAPTGGNHRTRRHWVRSKPSRFTRHRIY